MNVDQLRDFCLTLPEATENIQWGDDLCFKFRGKIFATIALTAVPPKVCFKCTPEDFAELTEREDIYPAPYVGRYKWVILDSLSALGRDELCQFVRQSYEMIAEKAPKAKVSGRRRNTTPKRKRTAPSHAAESKGPEAFRQ